ncbi:MAG: hypothetical protein JWM95_3686 [Gemmatimonadetes bacterium]|nr:hypothetical protein [Gemmatimonadota bacterium]
MMDSIVMFLVLLAFFAAPALPGLLPLMRRLHQLEQSTEAEKLLLPVTFVVYLTAAIGTGWHKGGSNIFELLVIGILAGIGALARRIALRRPDTSFTGRRLVIAVSIAAALVAIFTPERGG